MPHWLLGSTRKLRSITRAFGKIFGFRGEKREAGSVEELQRVIQYRFRSEALVRHSLTHKSYITANDPKGLLSNERLEFLGDAVLNCLVTEHLYTVHPDRSEGQLSKIKSLIVSRKILGEIARAYSLGNYLFVGTSEEKTGGRKRMSTLSNAFEAIIGAIYLDGGIDAAKLFLQRSLFSKIPAIVEDERNINYKSKILEMSQRDGFGVPRYVTIDSSGPDHAKEFTVRIEIAGVPMGEGNGPNKKIAQQSAAQNASMNYSKELILSRLKGDDNNEMVSQ